MAMMIPRGEFEDRFTEAEAHSIRFLAKADMTVMGWLVLFDLCESVDLEYPGVAHVLGWLVSQGILAENRFAEVMAWL